MRKITIIGLGEVGASVGLVLKQQGSAVERVGSDISVEFENSALKCGAIDRICHKVSDAVKDADIVVMCLPTDQTGDALKLIGPLVKKDTVVIETCPSKKAACSWAAEFLPDITRFISVYPSLNPAYLFTPQTNPCTPAEDKFKGGTIFISPVSETDESVIRLVSNFAVLAEAGVIFTNADEMDGFLAASLLLPNLAGNALFLSVLKQSGWKDIMKSGNRTFAAVTSPAGDPLDYSQFGMTLMENNENTIRLLNDYVYVLKDFIDALRNRDDKKLTDLLTLASHERTKWQETYESSCWRYEGSPDLQRPSTSTAIGQFFLGGLFNPDKKREQD